MTMREPDPKNRIDHCYFCASDNTEIIIKDRIDYLITEYLVRCKDCNNELGYWSYGHWQSFFAE